MLSSFRLAIFLGAGLLFVIQPLFAKMVLPMLGGSPAVWNTCMLFFQGMLLAGYAYAHVSQKLLGQRAQVVVHLVLLGVVLFLPAMTLPSDWSPPESETPIFWLLGVLLVVVGGPFFAVSATSPLLQQWFSATDHQRSTNPYFLYAASNAGSMLSLLAYPFLLERIFSLDTQASLWKYTYFAFVGSMIVCGVLVLRSKENSSAQSIGSGQTEGLEADDKSQKAQTESANADITWLKRIYWIGLSFVPSSWMLGVTSFLTTDITPMPILWIIPLTLYLITFIIAFSDRPFLSRNWMIRLFPVAMLLLVASTVLQGGFLILVVHLVIFFLGAMMCHFELANSKPSSLHLTEFYLWVSVGGLLGGVFNGLLAPLIFPWILEYPLTLMLACLLCPTFDPATEKSTKESHAIDSNSLDSRNRNAKSKNRKQRKRDEVTEVPSADDQDELSRKIKLGSIAAFALLFAALANSLGFQGTSTLIMVTLVATGGLCFLFLLNKPVWFALPLGVVLVLAKLEPPQPGETVLLTARGFFGVNRVVAGPEGAQQRLYHGTTVHGIQNLDSQRPDLRLEPMTYYHRTGPLGMIFDQAQKSQPFNRVGIIGLGAGTAAAYLKPGQRFVFFEIDPIVKQIAEDDRFFTFLESCGKDNYEIVLGDGRMKLNREAQGSFDFLVFDAFSSDAIPIHLLTREAIEMYASKLSEDGFMAFHISNLHFDLEPILGDIAAELGLDSLTCHDRPITEEEMMEGKAPASYVVIAKLLQRTGLAKNLKWQATRRSGRQRIWTDRFSNLFDALK